MSLPSPESPLDVLATPVRVDPGRWRVELPDQWQQGRGAFGGLLLAAMIRAIEAEMADPARALRSVTAEFCGPARPEAAELAVEVLREGSAVTTVDCRLSQGRDVQAHATAVLGRARVNDRDAARLQRPALPPWREIEPMPPQPPGAPVFIQFWEVRNAGPWPFSGEEPRAQGWIRPRNPGAARDAAYLAACADAWWPTLYVNETMPRPMVTVASTLEICGSFEGLDPEAPLFYRSDAASVRDGYFVELRELWGEDGRLLALNQQTCAIIK